MLVLFAAAFSGCRSEPPKSKPPPPAAAPAPAPPKPYAANRATALLPIEPSPPEREEKWAGTYSGTVKLTGLASGTVDFRCFVTEDGDGVLIEKASSIPGGIKCRAAKSAANKNLAACEGAYFTRTVVNFELAAAMHDDSLAIVVYTPDHPLASHPETTIQGMTTSGVLTREKPR